MNECVEDLPYLLSACLSFWGNAWLSDWLADCLLGGGWMLASITR